jgi:hypothetical protein
MRKFYLMTALALTFSATQLNAQETAIAEGVTTAPVIDGDLSDWDLSTNVQQGTKMQTVNSEWPWVPQDNLLYWKATWDNNCLYIAVAVVDNQTVNYVDEDKGDRIQFSIGADFAVKDGWGTSDNWGVYVMYKDEGEAQQGGAELLPEEFIAKPNADILGSGLAGYIVEIKVAWSQISITPAANADLLFNIQIKDYDQYYEDGEWKDNPSYMNWLAWATFDNTWSTMENAGKLTLDASTSSNNHIEMDELGFSLSPNPASSKLNVKIASDIQTISVFSITGQLMSNVEVANKNMVSIDVADLANGVYLLQVNTKDGVFTKRFVKE